MDRPAEIHTRDGGALPERSLRRQLVATDRGDAELGQIPYRAREPGRCDHVVDLEDELGRALRLARVYPEDLAGSLDPLDRRIENDHTTREDVILIRLHVSRADADERARVDRKLRRRRGREDDLLRPRQEAGRKLE